MIVGSGIDIVETARIKNATERWGNGFLRHVFTDKEIAYSQTKKFFPQHLAARFAAKEAIAKALGNGGLRFVRWKDIEIINDKTGKPLAMLYGYYKNLLREKGISKIIVSISHTKNYAVASAVMVSNEKAQT